MGSSTPRIENEVKTSTASSSPSSTTTTATTTISSSSSSWYVTALKNIGHYDPSSVANAIKTGEEGDSADEELVRLVMWLEDRLIRSW